MSVAIVGKDTRRHNESEKQKSAFLIRDSLGRIFFRQQRRPKKEEKN